MGAHGVLPTPRGERLGAPQLFKPADGRGIENDLRPLNRIHASRFRIPLVIADKRSNDRLAGVHLHIAEIARRKIVLLIIVGIMRNMHLPVFAGKRTVGVIHHRRVIELSVIRLLVDRTSN